MIRRAFSGISGRNPVNFYSVRRSFLENFKRSPPMTGQELAREPPGSTLLRDAPWNSEPYADCTFRIYRLTEPEIIC